MLCCVVLFPLSCDYDFSRIVVAQNTNPDRVVASAFQMGPPMSVECQDFLFFIQNLARDKTVDHSGTSGLVKVNSTTNTQQIPTMDFLST